MLALFEWGILFTAVTAPFALVAFIVSTLKKPPRE